MAPHFLPALYAAACCASPSLGVAPTAHNETPAPAVHQHTIPASLPRQSPTGCSIAPITHRVVARPPGFHRETTHLGRIRVSPSVLLATQRAPPAPARSSARIAGE